MKNKAALTLFAGILSANSVSALGTPSDIGKNVVDIFRQLMKLLGDLIINHQEVRVGLILIFLGITLYLTFEEIIGKIPQLSGSKTWFASCITGFMMIGIIWKIKFETIDRLGMIIAGGMFVVFVLNIFMRLKDKFNFGSNHQRVVKDERRERNYQKGESKAYKFMLGLGSIIKHGSKKAAHKISELKDSYKSSLKKMEIGKRATKTLYSLKSIAKTNVSMTPVTGFFTRILKEIPAFDRFKSREERKADAIKNIKTILKDVNHELLNTYEIEKESISLLGELIKETTEKGNKAHENIESEGQEIRLLEDAKKRDRAINQLVTLQERYVLERKKMNDYLYHRVYEENSILVKDHNLILESNKLSHEIIQLSNEILVREGDLNREELDAINFVDNALIQIENLLKEKNVIADKRKALLEEYNKFQEEDKKIENKATSLLNSEKDLKEKVETEEKAQAKKDKIKSEVISENFGNTRSLESEFKKAA